jgi:phosphatidylglycerol lysyltransferase
LAVAGVFVLLLLLAAVRDVLLEVRYDEIVAAMKATTATQLALAALATLLSYVALTGYDFAALRYAGARVGFRIVAPTSFAAYALSNTVGFGVLTGGAVRMRLYGAAAVEPTTISRAIAFGTISFGIGTGAVAAFGLLADSSTVAPLLHVPSAVLRAAAAVWLGLVAALLVACAGRRTFARSANRVVALPSLSLAAWQLFVSVADIVFAAAALWWLLPPSSVGPLAFVGFFAVATLLGVLSHSPGGVGVFEGVMLVTLSSAVPAGQLAGALLLYRGIYFFAPLAVALVMLSAYELRSATLSPLGRAARGAAPLLLAAFTFVIGVMLMVSGVTPASDDATAFLAEHVPLPLLEASHFLGSVAGLGLLFIARGMLLRLDVAWWAGVVLAGLACAAALPKGVAVSEAAVLVVLLVALVLSREQFTRKANLLAGAFGEPWLVAIAAAVVAIVGVLFFAYRDVAYAHDLWWQFEFDAHAPRSLRALVGLALLLLVLALRFLLRSPPPALHVPGTAEIERAERIVRSQDSSAAGLALLGDKHLLFSDSGRSFLMYGVRGRSWVALFDPVAPDDEAGELVWSFIDLARESGGRPAFYQVRPQMLPLYLDAGLRLFKVGEQALVPLQEFSLKGTRRSDLRHALNRGERGGLSFRVIPPSEVAPVLPELRRVSAAWLARRRAAEKGFSLGAFKDDYVARQGVAAIYQAETMVAFATLMTTDTKADASVDLMRYLPSAPPGTMDVLLVRLLLYFQSEGYRRFDLGMAPLSGIAENAFAPHWHRLAHLLFEHGESLYNFRGVRGFKDKFSPIWEPRYLATSGLTPFAALTNVAALVGGGLKGVFAK